MSFRDVVAAIRAGDETTGARPLLGGMHHSLFALTLPDGTPACCKLFAPNDRDADEREWAALCLLVDTGIAPLPLYHEPGAVVMSFVEGQGLGGMSLDAGQIAALAAQLRRLYRIPPPPRAAPVNGPAGSVERVREIHSRVASTNDRAVIAAGRWLATSQPDELKRLQTSVFGRGDPNLANCLWDPPTLTFVDWEYSGPSNSAFEIGDHIEHIQSRTTPDSVWGRFVDAFELTPAERHTVGVARRLMAVFWLLLLQPGQRAAAVNPPQARATQSERVLALLDHPV